MTRKFTAAVRQRILDDFVARHGKYDAAEFLREVRATNGSHEAWSWFEWRDYEAAEEYRIQQARTFVHGLKVKFEIVTTQRSAGTVVVRDVPAYLSPVEGRRSGGGYFQTDTGDEAHMAEYRRQAATALRNWLGRFGAAYESIGGSLKAMSDAATKLEASAPAADEEAA